LCILRLGDGVWDLELLLSLTCQSLEAPPHHIYNADLGNFTSILFRPRGVSDKMWRMVSVGSLGRRGRFSPRTQTMESTLAVRRAGM